MKNSIAYAFIIFMTIAVLASGCGKTAAPDKKSFNPDVFASVLEQARGTTVNFYGWGGDDQRNKWLDTVVVPEIKKKYDITLKRVPMDIDQILSKLSGEKQASEKNGSIDMIWINGENFYSAKENGFLYGPFAQKLPNFQKNIDTGAEEINYDFGYPIEGYEAPYGKAQMVFINDSAVTPETPKNTVELLEFAKKYRGRVTYPALPDFTGSAFVRNIICDIVGYKQFAGMKPDKEAVRQAIMPAIEYLKELNKYLWHEGKTFPATSALVTNMFADGELVLNMTYEPYSVATFIDEGKYPATARTFLFDKGTVGNTNYIAIAQNSPNKAGAMVVINELLSAQMQASQFNVLKTLPVVDYGKLSDEEKKLFDSVDTGRGTIAQSDLLARRIPEMPAGLVPVIEQIWLEEVVGK